MKKYFVLFVALTAMVISGCQSKVTKSDLKTLNNKVSYSIGLDYGKYMKNQSIEIDEKAFVQGLRDGLSADTSLKPLLTETEIRQVIQQFQEEMMKKQQEKMKSSGEKNKKDGAKFLEENKKKQGVKVTASGLQYKVIKAGNGKSPAENSTVTAHYKGTLIDGTEFDNSYKRGQPAELPVSGIIKGWTEALLLMKEGDIWELYIPSELAYGETGRQPQIAPNAVLVFQVELIKVNESK